MSERQVAITGVGVVSPRGLGLPAFLDALFEGRFKAHTYGRMGRELAARIAAGGYPAALARATAGGAGAVDFLAFFHVLGMPGEAEKRGQPEQPNSQCHIG